MIQLKPGERVVIGASVVRNKGGHRAHLEISGDLPVLREPEVMREAEATTPCKRVYFTLQAMYLSADTAQLQETYFRQIRDIRKAAPSTAPYFRKINEQLRARAFHKALRETRRLIDYETKLLSKS
jgi:flagellar protein FlbT